MDGKILRGAVATSSNGSIGIIAGCQEQDGKLVYFGTSLTGRHWTSSRPTIIAYSIAEYISDTIESAIASERNSYLQVLYRDNSQYRAASDIISLINDTAVELRDQRKIAPFTVEDEDSPARPAGQVTFIDTEEFNIRLADSPERDLVMRLWQEPKLELVEPPDFAFNFHEPTKFRPDDHHLELKSA